MAYTETLGYFLAKLMQKRNLSNRELARLAEVSEGAIRNLLRYGNDPRAQDPDPRTLTKVADALFIDPLALYRLAGYAPPSPQQHLTARGIYLAQLFERLPLALQMALLGVAEALIEGVGGEADKDKERLRAIRENPEIELAGFHLINTDFIRIAANEIIKTGALADVANPEQMERFAIPIEMQLGSNMFGELPQNIQERIAALIREKFALDFDPSMIDEQWRY